MPGDTSLSLTVSQKRWCDDAQYFCLLSIHCKYLFDHCVNIVIIKSIYVKMFFLFHAWSILIHCLLVDRGFHLRNYNEPQV